MPVKVKILLIVAYCFALCGCRDNGKAQTEYSWDDDLSAEQNVARTAAGFDGDEHFPFLEKIADDNRVIILGESTHFDLTTTDIKSKMVGQLQKSGYNAITYECVPFLAAYAYNDGKYDDITKIWDPGHVGPWGVQPTFEPTANLIRNKGIKLVGMDIPAWSLDFQVAEAIFESNWPDDLPDVDWSAFCALHEKLFIIYTGEQKIVSTQEKLDYVNYINKLSNHTEFLLHKHGTSIDLRAVIQWVKNLRRGYQDFELFPLQSLEESESNNEFLRMTALYNTHRDNQMADNVLWYLNNFPDEKLIIWCANFHGAKAISQTIYPRDTLLYSLTTLMGEILHENLQDKIYSLAFVSLNENGDTSAVESGGALEKEIAVNTKDSPYAFIDYRSLRFAEGFDKEFESSALGSRKKPGKWTYIFDGLFYIRDQKTSRVK